MSDLQLAVRVTLSQKDWASSFIELHWADQCRLGVAVAVLGGYLSAVGGKICCSEGQKRASYVPVPDLVSPTRVGLWGWRQTSQRHKTAFTPSPQYYSCYPLAKYRLFRSSQLSSPCHRYSDFPSPIIHSSPNCLHILSSISPDPHTCGESSEGSCSSWKAGQEGSRKGFEALVFRESILCVA